MAKRICFLVLVLILVTSLISETTSARLSHDHKMLATAPDSGLYVGILDSYIFHLASCRYVANTVPANKVYFDTRDEAIDAGFVPCKVCNP